MVKKLAALLLLLVGFGVLLSAGGVLATAEPQLCKNNSACIVGEFLFDDNYIPISVGVTCNLTSRDANGNMFINNGVMTGSGQNDGWNSYTINVGATEGIYPTQMCCTVPANEGVGTTQYMCLDKSFRVGPGSLTSEETANAVWDSQKVGHTNPGSMGNNLQNPTLTAADFWTYANRTLSAGSSLVQEIWDYTENSTNNFAALVAKIWSHSTVNTLASKTDVVGVATSLATIEGKIDSLDNKVSSIGTTMGTILDKWGSYSASDIISNVTTVQNRLGTNSDSCVNNTIFGNIACVKDKWGTQTADSLYTAANNAYSVGTSLRAELNFNGKSTTAFDEMQTIKDYVDTLEAAIGNSSDLASAGTVFGKIKGNKEDIADVKTVVDSINTKVDSVSTKVDSLVDKWGSSSVTDILSGVNTIKLGLGNSGDGCFVNTVFGNIACVKDKWGTQTADSLYTAANNAYNTAIALRTELNYSGKSTNAYDDIQNIKDYVDSLETSIGNTSDLSTNGTLFGKIKGNKEDVAVVKTTIDSIETKIDTLNTKTDNISTNVSSLLTKWGSFTVADVIGKINGIGSSLGTGSDGCAINTVFGNIACVRDKWGTKTAEDLYTAANNAFTTITSLRSELDYSGKSSTAYADLQSVKNYVDSLETSIGSSSDLSSAETIFGKIKGNKEDVAGVQTSIDSISDRVDLLSTGMASLNSNVNTLISKWGSYSVADVMSNVNSVKSSIGASGDGCGNTTTIFGGIACLQNNSGGVADNSAVLAAVSNVASLVTELTSELNFNGKSTTAFDEVAAIKNNVGVMLAAMGSSSDLASENTVFGRMKKIQTTVEALDVAGGQATTVIDKWGTLSAEDIYNKVKDLSAQIAAVNTVTNVDSILKVSQASVSDLQDLKNQILAMKALINVNQTLLEKTTAKPVIKTWLEEGSIIFKTMITNPGTVSQTVPLKFYLPKEADKKNIIKIDAGLDVIFDPNEGAFYVSGEVDLKPNETRIVAIEVEDIWKIDESQIASLKIQAEELATPLKETAYFAQGVTLKSDIIVQLENIARTQKEAITPDSRIKAYRENSDLLKRVQNEINDLKSLVTQASSSGNLMGFVGGSQAFSLWGVVVVLIVGIAFLTVYMRTAIIQLGSGKKERVEVIKKRKLPKIKMAINSQVLKLIMLMIITVVPTFVGTWMLMNKFARRTPVKKNVAMVIIPTVTPVPTKIEEKKPVLGTTVEKIKIAIPEGSTSIKIRIGPDPEALILARMWAARSVDKYSEQDEWIEIGTKLETGGKTQFVRGWIRKICEVNK